MIKQLHLVPVNFLIFSNSGFGQNQDWEHLPVSVFLLILRTSHLVYINLKIHFSAGVVLETHLCRATCHRHDAGLERLLLLLLHGLHGLHGRLVWISLRKFTTTPGRGGAGGMLDFFFCETHEIIKTDVFYNKNKKGHEWGPYQVIGWISNYFFWNKGKHNIYIICILYIHIWPNQQLAIYIYINIICMVSKIGHAVGNVDQSIWRWSIYVSLLKKTNEIAEPLNIPCWLVDIKRFTHRFFLLCIMK